MERGDSDGEDAMAYFLPNGIADDSPPKRSTQAPSSFGPIGGRFGGIYGASTSATSMSTLDLAAASQPRAAPLYGSLRDALVAKGSTPTAASATRPSFLLSDLGGEVHTPRANDAGHAIGGGRNPFAFSGAFASLSAAESGGGRGGLFDSASKRNDLGGGSATASAASLRDDTDIFAASTSSGLNSSASLYGGPTLNANAPAFMASSAKEASLPFGSSSPSVWPTMDVKPRRVLHAPPGLSKPTDAGGDDGGLRSRPPGLARPSHSSAFGGFASSPSTTSTSIFSGGSRQFSSNLQPSYPSLTETFLSAGRSTTSRDFHSALSELNAKSMSVEEIQSNLKATAIAAAQDVVSEPVTQKSTAPTTPRKTAKSPRLGNDAARGRPPPAHEEKRYGRGTLDPRLSTPTRRSEQLPVISAPGSASPVAASRGGDRRARIAREKPAPDSATRNARAATADSTATTKPERRTRGGGGQAGSDRAGHRNTLAGAISSGAFQMTHRKKPPSSVSSVESDDHLLAVSTLVEVVEDSQTVQAKVKESPREARQPGRTASAKKGNAAIQTQEKRGGSRRQVYREKAAAAPEVVKPGKVITNDESPQGGSEADASGGDSQTDDAPGEDGKAAPVTTTCEAVSDVVDETSVPKAAPGTRQTEPGNTLTHAKSRAPVSRVKVPSPKKTPAHIETNVIETSDAIAENEDASTSTPTPTSPITPTHAESDSGSEIPNVTGHATRSGHSSDRKTSAKEHKKDKHKKEKAEKKKTVTSAKSNKKEKRDSSSSGKCDLADDEPFGPTHTKKQHTSVTTKIFGWLRDGRLITKKTVVAVWSALWFLCTEFADRINLKGFLGWTFSYLESFLAVVFSVVLLLSLHGASFFIRLHRVAFRAVLTHRHVGFCFAFLYAFPFLVQYVFPWAPPWAPVCLWYAFLVQLFCTSGPTAMVATFRIILPLVFLIEGISHHSFLLDLNGAELLLASFILSAMKTSNLCSPIFLLSLAVQCFSAVFLGSELVVQWFQMTLALYSLHAMAATDEDWAGLGDDEEDVSCRPLSMHHSIADYNYHPAPSAPSIQKSKRLDRRALAYVRGRKLR